MNNTLTFEDIFRPRMFRIPDYQRGYAWEEKHINDLIEDLEVLPSNRSHFTGTLVVRNSGEGKFRDESGQNYEIVDVIDGQQRLTSVVIFLDVIHDEFKRLGMETLADGLKKIYLAVLDRNSRPYTKLTLNRDCQEYFYNNVLGFAHTIKGPEIRSHENLLNAHRRIESYLLEQQNKQGDHYPNWLADLYYKITQGLTVLLYEVESEMDAGVIFETMNDRGKELTDLEKVKNHLLYLASNLELDSPHNLKEQINHTWNHIYEELMASRLGDDENESQLLRAHWLVAYDAQAQNWKRYQTIRNQFSLKGYYQQHLKLLHDLVEYLESLRNAATAYCDIYNPYRPRAFNNITDLQLQKKVRAVSEQLVRMGVRATFLPVLIAIRLKSADGGTTYLQVLQLCEKFGFRVYLWLRFYASAGQSVFFRLGRQFYEKPDPQRLIASISRATLDYCPKERFIERFQRETEDWYHWSGLKYFLYEYERHLAERAREPVRVQWDDLWDTKRDTIEHILPQTPSETWLTTFPDEARRKRWTHDIGNLTLTYDNSALQNKAFVDKRGDPSKAACYASSSLFIERGLAAYPQWTEAELVQRRTEIENWAISQWHVDEMETPESQETGNGHERIKQLADDGGVGDIYQKLLIFAEQHDLYLRPYPKSMVFSPMSNRTIALMTTWPRDGYLETGFWFPNIEKHQGISIKQLQSIFDTDEPRITVALAPSNIDDYLLKLAACRRGREAMEIDW
jgi:hypothetical protein